MSKAPRTSTMARLSIAVLALLLILAAVFLVRRSGSSPFRTVIAGSPQPSAPQGPTVIHVDPAVLHDDVERFGMNLGGEDFYDSLQLLKNLVSRNPGFEGQQWQTVLRCIQVAPTSCTVAANSGAWPEGFLDGGTYEVLSGDARGQTGSILHSTVANVQLGTTLTFTSGANFPAANDYIVVRKSVAGDAAAGWDAQTFGGATITTELKDLSPSTRGLQAARITALQAGQYVYLKAYFDTTAGRSFVQLRGPYVIHFRAKAVAGKSSVGVSVQRARPDGSIFQQTVNLTGAWQDYTLRFNAAEPTSAVGTLIFQFTVEQAVVLLDDVSLEEADTPGNHTAFRNDVVATLERLHPGVLRYMDSGGNWGSNLDNMLAPGTARKRSGYNTYLTEPNDIPVGLHDFLVLCERIGADPWYSMQIGSSTSDSTNLMEYLSAPASTKYGAIRAALGHPKPWTQTFHTIHLEFGNEAWNDAQSGAAMHDAVAYAQRATTIFQAMRGSPYYLPGHFDMIANSQAVNHWLTNKILETAEGLDTIDIAPYIFSSFNDDTSTEHIFGPMFAQPEMIDTEVDGYVHRQATVAATARRTVRLAVYETNMGTVSGTVSQASVDATVPSLGAGLAATDHMLLMLRDAGIKVQNTFQLGGSSFHFTNSSGRDNNETSPVWAVVVDMGGPTNRVRPAFLAQQLADEAIRPTMLTTKISGTNPTWHQPLSTNDKIEYPAAHDLQSFAFTDGKTNSLILLNLSRTTPHSITLAGPCAPQGAVKVRTLTSSSITDNNELDDKVKVLSHDEQNVVTGASTFSLPPFSMTTLSSNTTGCTPVR